MQLVAHGKSGNLKEQAVPIVVGAISLLIFVIVSVSWTIRTYEIDAGNLTEATPPLQAALWYLSFVLFAGAAIWFIVLRRKASKK